MDAVGISAIVVVVFALSLIRAGAKLVPQSRNWTLKWFGSYTQNLKPGRYLSVPFVDRIGEKVNMMITLQTSVAIRAIAGICAITKTAPGNRQGNSA